MADCIFCKIAGGEIPAQVVLETDDVICFEDVNPQAPVHLLIVPKKHVTPRDESLIDDQQLIGKIYLCARQAAEQVGINQSGFRLISNTGKDAGQEVDHLHFHVLGGKGLGPLITSS